MSGPQQIQVLAESDFWKRKDAGVVEATYSSPHGLLSTVAPFSPAAANADNAPIVLGL